MKRNMFLSVLLLLSVSLVLVIGFSASILNMISAMIAAGTSAGLSSELLASLSRVRIILGAGGLTTGILLAAAAVLFTIGVRRSLTVQTRFIEQLTDGETGIPEKLPFSGQKEITSLNTALGRLFTEMRRFILQIKNTGMQSQEIGEDLLKQTSDISTQTTTIKTTMDTVENKVGELDAEVEESETAVQEMNQYISSVNEQIAEQSSAVSESSASVEELIASIKNIASIAEAKGTQAESLAELAKVSDGEMRKTSDVIRKVSDSTSVVMEMVEVINDIAGRTDLLAMNAAIEAAHAGSYGRGFAVVAQEIRNLAESARENAGKMSANLKQVVENVNSMSEIGGGLAQSNRTLIDEINEVADGVHEMQNGTEEMSAGSDQISSALGNLVATSDQLKEAASGMESRLQVVERSVGSLKDLSKMNADSAQAVSETVAHISRATGMLEKLGQVNERNVGTLNHYVARFPVRGNVLAENLPPYNFLQNGEPVGLAIDIVRAMYMQMNKTAEIEFMRWEEAQEAATKQPDVLLLTVFRSEERESLFKWIGPAFQEQVHLFALKQRTIGSISDISSRQDLRIGTQRGNLETQYLIEKGFKKEHNLFLYEDTSRLIQALFSNEVDLIPMGKLQMLHQLQAMQRDPSDLESVYALNETSTDLYMAVGTSTADETVSLYRQAFRTLKQSQEYRQILERWS